MGLAWMGFRAPAVAALLFGAALGVAAWALLAAGGLGIYGPIGLTVHRRGLLLLAAALVLLPLVSGRVRHAELDVPCWLAAAVLLRIGMVRWGGLEEPGPDVVPATTSAPRVAGTVPGGRGNRPVPPQPARVAGRLTGRAGTVLGREAAAALPKAARAAGRAIGRTASNHPDVEALGAAAP